MKEILYTAELRGKVTLSKLGEWYHEGKRFERKALNDLFHRSIVWDPVQESYFIEIGSQRATFTCEDTAYFVVAVDESKTPWQVVLAGSEREDLDPNTLSLGSENQFYCLVKGGHKARFSKAAHQHLLRYVIDEQSINIAGTPIKIAKTEAV